MVAPSTHQTATDSGVQRVTLAVLATKLDYLIQKVEGMCKQFSSLEGRISSLERHSIEVDNLVDDAHKKIDRTNSQIGRALKWVGGIVAVIVAAAIIYWAGWR